MTEDKKNKHAQNAEILMWLAFVCCGMVIAFAEKRPPLMMLMKQEDVHSRVPSLIDGIAAVAALLMCFPPFHRRIFDKENSPLAEVGARVLVSFFLIGISKGFLLS